MLGFQWKAFRFSLFIPFLAISQNRFVENNFLIFNLKI